MFSTRLKNAICAVVVLTASVSYVYAAECDVATFEPHDNQHVHRGVGTAIPGSNLANVPVHSSTERCAQIIIECSGYGGTIVDADDLTATFANGKQRTGKLDFENFRLHGGESKTVFTCFGSSAAPIVSIEGRF